MKPCDPRTGPICRNCAEIQTKNGPPKRGGRNNSAPHPNGRPSKHPPNSRPCPATRPSARRGLCRRPCRGLRSPPCHGPQDSNPEPPGPPERPRAQPVRGALNPRQPRGTECSLASLWTTPTTTGHLRRRGILPRQVKWLGLKRLEAPSAPTWVLRSTKVGVSPCLCASMVQFSLPLLAFA